MYLPALPQIGHDLHTTQQLTQLTLTCWFFGTASLQLLLGPISDRYGRRAILLISGMMFILSTISCAIVTQIILLLVARFIQGCTVCSVIVTGYAAIYETYKVEQVVPLLALMSSITLLAPAFGPLIGGIILKFTSWRFIFWGLAFFASIFLLALFKWMPESNDITQRSFLSIKKLLNNYFAILRDRFFLRSTLAYGLIFSGTIAWLVVGPFLIIKTFHYSPFIFGIFQVFVFSISIICARLIKYAIRFMKLKKVVMSGLMLALCGAFLILFSTFFFPDNIFYFINSLMLYVGGTALTLGPLQQLAIASSQKPLGATLALFSNLVAGFEVLASIIMSTFYHNIASEFAGFIVILTILSCLLVI